MLVEGLNKARAKALNDELKAIFSNYPKLTELLAVKHSKGLSFYLAHEKETAEKHAKRAGTLLTLAKGTALEYDPDTDPKPEAAKVEVTEAKPDEVKTTEEKTEPEITPGHE